MYKCNSHTWEREFTDFIWIVKSIFNDRANNKTLIEIEFGETPTRSRTLETSLINDTSELALDYAKSILSDEVIEEQDPTTITVGEYSTFEKYEAWSQEAEKIIIEFNAASNGLSSNLSGMILSHLSPVLQALNGGALGVARDRLILIETTPFFPQVVKDYWINRIQTYLDKWN